VVEKSEMKKSVSVLMTTYNCSATIRESISSVLSQTYSNYELVIIDDGSTDTTESIIKSFDDDRIRYHKIKHVGRSKALNYGLKKCNYDWVALQDADDISLPDRLERQIQRILRKEDIIFGSALFFTDLKVLFAIKPPNNLNLTKMYLHGNIINGTLLFNRKFILEFGGYNEKYENVEDFDLYLRIGNVAKFKNLEDILVLCNWRQNSLSRRDVKKLRKNFWAIQDFYFSSLNGQNPKYQITISDEDEGWREFFYGNKSRSRYYWRRNFLYFRKGRVFIAFLLTFFPESVFLSLLKNDFILRIKYVLFTPRQVKIQHKKILLSGLPRIHC